MSLRGRSRVPSSARTNTRRNRDDIIQPAGRLPRDDADRVGSGASRGAGSLASEESGCSGRTGSARDSGTEQLRRPHPRTGRRRAEAGGSPAASGGEGRDRLARRHLDERSLHLSRREVAHVLPDWQRRASLQEPGPEDVDGPGFRHRPQGDVDGRALRGRGRDSSHRGQVLSRRHLERSRPPNRERAPPVQRAHQPDAAAGRRYTRRAVQAARAGIRILPRARELGHHRRHPLSGGRHDVHGLRSRVDPDHRRHHGLHAALEGPVAPDRRAHHHLPGQRGRVVEGDEQHR